MLLGTKITIMYSDIADNTVSAADGVCSSANFDSKSDVQGNSLLSSLKLDSSMNIFISRW